VIRKEVQEMVSLGPLPDENADVEIIARHSAALEKIVKPVSDDEAMQLIDMFGNDDCFGLAWTLLHIIETASHGAPLTHQPKSDANEWLRLLWDRAHR
jgi:hypothetical protein